MIAPLIFRADAGLEIGSGHVMRCAALAQAWQNRGGAVVFAGNISGKLASLLEAQGMQVRQSTGAPGSSLDAQSTIRLARDSPGSWVVIDGYHFGSLFQQQIADSETGVACIDDNAHLDHYFGRILLNQNIHAAPGMYDGRVGSSMKLLLGPEFCLLRQEFASTPAPPRDHDRVKRLVVTFGGSDPAGLTPRVLRILAPLAESDWEVRVVIGPGNAHSAEVADIAATLMKGRIQLLVQPGSMRDVFAWADIAISAAGSTLYELMYMGVPTIAVVVAENQKLAQVALERSGTMLTLPDVERIGVELPSCLERLCQDRALRVHMSAAGRRMVDGAGAARVSDVILEQMNG